MTAPHALLFTDVVDSTSLSHRLGDAAMSRLWAAHDRAARDLLALWRGREIEKTDGLIALFDSADDAVGFALGYHRALALLQPPMAARAAVHVGAITLRESTDADIGQGAKRVEVDGLVKPVVARVMAVALGGQTLLTGDARQALGASAGQVLGHGHWQLKGLPDPIELFEVGETGAALAPFTPPPDGEKAWRVVRQRDLWVPAREVRHTLPAERDSFVGRRADLQLLAGKLEGGARLISVLGMGGTGKTRFVTRFAWQRLGNYAGGIWFCDLSQARTPDGISFAVAQGLGVTLERSAPSAQIASTIGRRGRCLVILDNFEQVARFAFDSLGGWLDHCPEATFLVTTREVLGLAGETVFALAPLPNDDASELFHRRALAACHDYAPGETDLAAAAKIAQMLDGLPLAIELAAARTRVMTAKSLLAKMNERFTLLRSVGGRQDRQATLRATFDWSWDLLPDVEKAALAQMSVFEGGFTMETAAAVLDPGVTRPDGPEYLVQGLADKSLVRRVSDTRFDLLESVREYAAEHLQTEGRFARSGPLAAAEARWRHAVHFAGFDERRSVTNQCADLNNLISACRHAASLGRADETAGALVGAWFALRLTGPMRVAVDLAQLCLRTAGPDGPHRGAVEWVIGSALEVLGDGEVAARHFETGLSCALAHGDLLAQARIRAASGAQRRMAGRPDEAARELRVALDLARSIGDRSLECTLLNSLGRVADQHGDGKAAQRLYEGCLLLAREIGDHRMEGGVLGNIGGLHHDAGRLMEARTSYERALALAREVGDRRWEGSARCNLGLVYLDQGEPVDALAAFEASLRIAQDAGHAELECTTLCNMGLAHEALADLPLACAHFQRAVSRAQEIGSPRSSGQFSGYLAVALARQGRSEEASCAIDAGEDLLSRSGDRLSLALLLCQRAEVERLGGNSDAAPLNRARALALELQVEPDSELSVRLAALEAPLRNAASRGLIDR